MYFYGYRCLIIKNLKAYVSVKNFASGLEWIWTKNKFLDRKAEFTELYLDFKDDGIINKDKFKVKLISRFKKSSKLLSRGMKFSLFSKKNDKKIILLVG